tara:strand:+ start:2207 stop:3187 length:981 start_codon:yes stop_codon:yes gene_type:complete
LEVIKLNAEKILVTGSSGFIGMHLCKNLLDDGYDVMGIDNMNDYYDPILKKARLNVLLKYKNFRFTNINISKYSDLKSIFSNYKPRKVVNLAAQAGVRYSLENPHAYINSNILGFINILEVCRHYDVENLIYASSSSVYGGNIKIPFSIHDEVNTPISIYAATKRSNELMAYTYHHLYGLKSIGLRFFTVYGPWGRPDMAIYIFTEKINNSEPIDVYNEGAMYRDFTYIDDIINGTRLSIEKNYDYEIFNLGNNKRVKLLDMISILEKKLNKKAKLNLIEMQPGDVESTFADITYSKEKLGFNPRTNIEQGIKNFIKWYKYYKNLS